MMRRILLLAATVAAISATPAFAWWRAGGLTPAGTAWHAGGAAGYRWGGAYHPPAYGSYYHGYSAYPYHPYYRAPVPVVPYYPAAGVAAGAAVGAAAGVAVGAAAASSAAATAQHYSQPAPVVNNYYYNEK